MFRAAPRAEIRLCQTVSFCSNQDHWSPSVEYVHWWHLSILGPLFRLQCWHSTNAFLSFWVYLAAIFHVVSSILMLPVLEASGPRTKRSAGPCWYREVAHWGLFPPVHGLRLSLSLSQWSLVWPGYSDIFVGLNVAAGHGTSKLQVLFTGCLGPQLRPAQSRLVGPGCEIEKWSWQDSLCSMQASLRVTIERSSLM